MTRRRGRPDTRIAHSGRDRKLTAGGVNPVVQRASTVLVEKSEDLYAPGAWTYGRHGTATHAALKDALCELEDAKHCALVPSGLLSCTIPFFALARAGGHVLVTDAAYGPTRRFCDRSLKRWGCEAEYFDPRTGGGIASKLRPETCLVFIESPGSLTFEVSDIPAIAEAASKAGVPVVVDNTWSGGVFCKPLALGADISVQANTKYVSGGADTINGSILTNRDDLARKLEDAIADLGLNVSPDDAWLVMRGVRSLHLRMQRHEAAALEIARWLQKRPEIANVIHPALDDHPDHAMWARDFTGSSGLFGVVLKPASTKQVNAFLDALELFGLGFSYGGFESLAIHCDPQLKRALGKPPLEGPLIRLSIGLEDPADLIADIEQALSALTA
jgi:cystathionine beta-lyase